MNISKLILLRLAILFSLNIFFMNFVIAEVLKKPNLAIKELLENDIKINKVLEAQKPCSFEYSAVFGSIISDDLDDEILQKNLLNYIKVGLWLYQDDESLQYDIENIIAYLRSLPERYKEYDFKSCISEEEIDSLEDSYSEISESHSHSSSEASSEPSSPEEQTSGSKLIELK